MCLALIHIFIKLYLIDGSVTFKLPALFNNTCTDVKYLRWSNEVPLHACTVDIGTNALNNMHLTTFEPIDKYIVYNARNAITFEVQFPVCSNIINHVLTRLRFPTVDI